MALTTQGRVVELSVDEVALASFTFDGTTFASIVGLNAILVIVSIIMARAEENLTWTGVTPSRCETPHSIGVSLSSLPFMFAMLNKSYCNIAISGSSFYC